MTRPWRRAHPGSHVDGPMLRGNIHEAIADRGVLWLGQRSRSEHIDWCGPTDAPDRRLLYLRVVFGCWGVVAVASLVATIVLVGPVWFLLGERAAQIAFVPGYVACWFCLAGMPYASWRRHFASRANRRAKKHGADDPRVLRAMARSIPGNDSIAWQLAVALIAGWLYASSL